MMISFNAFIALLPSLACFFICLYLVKTSLNSKLWRSVLAMAHLVLCLISIFYLIGDSLSGNGIDESVFFHLLYGMEGAGANDFARLYVVGSVLVALSILGAFWIFRASPSSRRVPVVVSGVAVLGMFFSFFINPASKDLSKFLVHAQFVDAPSGLGVIRLISDDAIGATSGDWDADNDEDGSNFEEFYYEPKGADFSNGKPNLVYIYMESFERTYLNEKTFPGLVKHLRKYERQALNFTGIQQVFGTGWTIGGIVASQCGIPLVTTGGHGNEMGMMDEFLPGARCLGEVLRDKGYRLAFRGGADLNFAGKGKFLKNHGFADVKGLYELKPDLKDPTYLNNWGLYDDSLMDIAYQDFLRLGKSSQPFGLFLLTVDTHHPEGHIPRSCTDSKYQDGENSVLNAVKCSDQIVARFLDRIFASPLAANTVVVIASDHFAMPNTARDQLEALDRKNLFMIIPPGGSASRDIARRGSTLDIAPTILQVLTGKSQPVGLGRSLLESSRQNLTEQMGERLDGQLKGWSADIRRFWRLPQIVEPVHVTVGDRTLTIGGRTVHYPALIDLDADLNVTKILFPDGDLPLHKRAYTKIGSRVIWIDDCQAMKVLSTKVTAGTECLLAGIMGSTNVYVHPLLEDTELPLEIIQKVSF